MSSRQSYAQPAVALLIGLIVTAALAVVSHGQYVNNEKHLLRLRVGDAGALLGEALPSSQTPLASAAELADATGGNAQKFKRFVAPYIGAKPGQPFVSMSLWSVADPGRGPLAVAGLPPKLVDSPSLVRPFLARVATSSTMSVVGLLGSPDPRIGYAYATPGVPGGFAVYGESRLPASRQSRYQSTSAFAGLNYALYLGRGAHAPDLLVTDLKSPPLSGQTASVSVPFGDTAVTLVMRARGSLAGALPEDLPSIIAVAGLVLTIAAAFATLRLTERRRHAEQLAGRLEITAEENERLFAEQRDIAQTLQHALLPDVLPHVPGIQASAVYEAGEQGVEIGGDWYDVLDLGERRVLLVVGDVSGRGLRAAATMASLRFAIHAYAAQNDPPATILRKLSSLLDVTESGQLATILCALVDLESREITVTSAGHLPPLLITDDGARYLEVDVGPPIGVEAGVAYASTTTELPPSGTLIGYTDGLIEIRGEDLDQGLARLRDAAAGDDGSLPDLLSNLTTGLRDGPLEDDTAMVGLRWTQ